MGKAERYIRESGSRCMNVWAQTLNSESRRAISVAKDTYVRPARLHLPLEKSTTVDLSDSYHPPEGYFTYPDSLHRDDLATGKQPRNVAVLFDSTVPHKGEDYADGGLFGKRLLSSFRGSNEARVTALSEKLLGDAREWLTDTTSDDTGSRLVGVAQAFLIALSRNERLFWATSTPKRLNLSDSEGELSKHIAALQQLGPLFQEGASWEEFVRRNEHQIKILGLILGHARVNPLEDTGCCSERGSLGKRMVAEINQGKTTEDKKGMWTALEGKIEALRDPESEGCFVGMGCVIS